MCLLLFFCIFVPNSINDKKMNKRNGYLISKALHTFMWASILSSVAQLLSTLVDAVVVSNLIGPSLFFILNFTIVREQIPNTIF